MSKVLFVSNYKDGTGYSSAALSYIEAMDSVGIDLVIRPLRFNDAQPKLPERILELEQKSSQGCDAVIQYTLPHFMQYHGGFKKNIAMFESETDNIQGPNWHTHLNLMDEVWSTNQEQHSILINQNRSKVTKPIKYIGHAVNTEKFQKSYEKLPIGSNGRFMFFFVGEFNIRKNLGAIIRAFNTEFSITENVGLLFKIGVPGMSPQDCAKGFTDYCQQVKNGLKLYRNPNTYHREFVIVDRIDEEVLYSLYTACDCFVNASRGEGWNIPTAEAAAMGKSIISSRCGGMLDYLNDDNAWLVDGQFDDCFGYVDGALPDMYRADEKWFEININSLRKAMREVFENKDKREEKSSLCMKNIFENFNKKTVGQRIKDLLGQL